jgi:putative hydroxymethylpyrimidine transport system ATP-binding protein
MLKEKSLEHNNRRVAGGALEIRSLHKSFASLEVIHNLTLTVKPGEFVTMIGPSGCGKSTVFNILVGLEEASAGEIRLDGSLHSPRSHQFAYMPQRDALLPWRTILDNVILGLELQGVPKRTARTDALDLFEAFGLKGFEKSYPFELSGGMRQRAALLRTVLTQRPLLLLDEPFGALDALTRSSLQEWLLQLQARLGRTILFITHDVEEAILLSDRVYVLSPRPATVTLEQEIHLPRPRSVELVTSPAFVALKARLLAALRNPQTQD